MLKRLFLLGLAAGIFLLLVFSFLILSPQSFEGEPIVMIAPGSAVPQIASALEEKSIIRNAVLFRYMARILGYDQKMQAGEYRFASPITMMAVMGKMARGEKLQRFVTIPEGLTNYEMKMRLAASEGLFGDIPDFPPEGSLLPETYAYHYGDRYQDVLQHMEDAMAKTLDEIWAMRGAGFPLKSKEEILTLASIIEKETAIDSERTRIAGVFFNRLRIGMPLQSDPTVIYAITKGKGKDALGRDLLKKDLTFDHPINTYKYRGLPPQPICNPGRASLLAVMNPLPTDELYFVADGTGGHVFARTLDEHNRNVANYRRWQKDQKK